VLAKGSYEIAKVTPFIPLTLRGRFKERSSFLAFNLSARAQQAGHLDFDLWYCHALLAMTEKGKGQNSGFGTKRLQIMGVETGTLPDSTRTV
jgi:hypothetical protein